MPYDASRPFHRPTWRRFTPEERGSPAPLRSAPKTLGSPVGQSLRPAPLPHELDGNHRRHPGWAIDSAVVQGTTLVTEP
ncbi:hypothetical protein GCM10010519_38810 [Streptomyces lactacystinicus]